MSKGMRIVGGPSPDSSKNRDKDNSFRDRLLARTIACRPANEDRLRGIA